MLTKASGENKALKRKVETKQEAPPNPPKQEKKGKTPAGEEEKKD